MKFSKDNQPKNRGRKPTGVNPTLRVSVPQDVKEYYQVRKGLAGRVLTDYKNMKTIEEMKAQIMRGEYDHVIHDGETGESGNPSITHYAVGSFLSINGEVTYKITKECFVVNDDRGLTTLDGEQFDVTKYGEKV